MQNLARNSRRYHAKILGGPYRQPLSYHLKSAMGTQTNSEGHTTVITPATLKTTLTEKLEASYVDVEDISGKSCPLLAYRIYMHTFRISRLVYAFGADDVLLSSRKSRRLRIILPGENSLPTLRKKVQSGTTSACKCCLKNGDCGYSCLDAKMFYARGVGETNTSRSRCCRE